jgi:hypothetical protein
MRSAYLNRAFKKYVGTPPRRVPKGPNSIRQGSDDVRFGSKAEKLALSTSTKSVVMSA